MNVTVFGEGIERVAVREITPSITWITHCLGDQVTDYYADFFAGMENPEEFVSNRVVDYPYSAFLIKDDKSILFDTIAPRQRANVLKALELALGDLSLDYIWISHVELPHGGNAAAIQKQYPDARLVTMRGGDHYGLHGLDDALLVAPGDVIELGKHTIEMVDALFGDHGLTQWAYERTTGFFYSADWGHNLHEPSRGQCFMFVDEMEATGYTREQFVDDVKVNARIQFPWLAWTDVDEIAAAVEKFLQQYDIRIFAPSHGNVIRKDPQKYLKLFPEAMRQAVALAARAAR